MSKTRVIIIEDEFFAANHLSNLIESLGYYVSGVYHSGEDFLRLTDWNFDAAVVDIFLSEEMSGLQVAEHLRGRNKSFIFLTANQDNRTLKEAARLNPAAYISKPFKTNDVVAALEIIVHQLAPKLLIRGLHGIEELSPSDVVYIKSDGAYIEIQTVKDKIIQRKLLKEMADQLPASFIRVHRSYLVNKDFIDTRTANVLYARGYEIPISRGYREGL